MTSLKGLPPLAAAGLAAVAEALRHLRRRTPLTPLLLGALAGCTDNAIYVRPGDSAVVPTDVLGLDAADLGAQTLDVAVTFKSDGVVQPKSSDTLYHSIEASLKSSGIGQLRRSGERQADVSQEIARLEPVESAQKTMETCAIPRLLVLVENHPDLRDGTEAKYFLSGMTFGSWSLSKTTDRYEITLAYRDRHGQARVYHGHQELVYSTGSTVFGRDDEPVAGLRRFDDPMAAFGAAMNNSIKGGPGVVKVGRPDFDNGAPPSASAENGTKR